MEKKDIDKSCVCFGPGYRKHEFVREVCLCPILASSTAVSVNNTSTSARYASLNSDLSALIS